MLSYFQILLGHCEANYVFSNFRNCFSCRITDQKIIKTRMEKPLCSFFELWAVWRRHWLFQEAAASTKQPQEVLNNLTKHQNKSQHSSGSSLSKSTLRTHHRAPGRHKAGKPETSTHPSETHLDLPVGTKLLPKLTAEIPGDFLDSKPRKRGKPTPSTVFSTIPGRLWMLGFFGLCSQYFLNSIHSQFSYWMWRGLKRMEVLKSQWREQKAFDHEEHPTSKKPARDDLHSEFS